MSTEIVRFEPTGERQVDLAVRYWGQGVLCPDYYRVGGKKENAPDWPSLTLACLSLQALEVAPLRNLPDTYVVHGRLGMMYPLQVALCQRSGYDVIRLQATPEVGVVEILRPGERRGEGQVFEVTYADAVRAGWPDRNPCYKSMPQKMLPARATTAAIAAVAPGVLRGIASSIAHLAQLDLDGIALEAPASAGGEVASTSPPEVRTSTPADLLRRQVTDALRRLEALAPETAAELRAEGAALRRATPPLPDRLLYAYILEEALDALAGAEESGVAVPEEVHDDAPESRGMDPDDDAAYAADDPARPF